MASTISNTSAAPLVLIADDLPHVIKMWTADLVSYGIGVIAATSLEELDGAYAKYKHVAAAVILDGCIPGNSLNTISFIKSVRADGFTRPVVASSSLREYRRQMLWAGCSHEAEKEQAAELVADLLSAP